MSLLTTTRQVTLPRVNLLPPEIEMRRRFHRTQVYLGATVVGVVGLVAAMYVVTALDAAQAEEQLVASQGTGSALAAEADTYAAVPLTYAAVDSKETQIELAMGQEIRWSFLLNDLSARTPETFWIDTMTVSQDVDRSATQAVSADVAVPDSAAAYTAPSLAQITFAGYALGHNDVATWLEALAARQGYAQPYFTNSTAEDIGEKGVVAVSSQVNVTSSSLSGRYAKGVK